jgi:hypothetical protein
MSSSKDLQGDRYEGNDERQAYDDQHCGVAHPPVSVNSDKIAIVHQKQKWNDAERQAQGGDRH